MAQGFIHVRVDDIQKKDAEKILNNLGLTMTTGIHLFLNSIIRCKGLPFEIALSREELLGEDTAGMERRMQIIVADELERDREEGHPVALYDRIRKCPYLEYPDGRREYADE